MDNNIFKPRYMNNRDFPSFDGIQNAAYEPLFIESEAIFYRRLELFPEGAWITEDGTLPVGYLICHPWLLNDLVSQHGFNIELPTNCDCFYIHSLTIIPTYHHKGIGRMFYEKAKLIADSFSYQRIALVSVQDSYPFWARFGFREVSPAEPLMKTKLAEYGPSARYMVRNQ